jgi:excisionase family DNA binding protein
MRTRNKPETNISYDLEGSDIESVMETLAEKYNTDNRLVRIQFPDQNLEIQVTPLVVSQVLKVIQLTNQGQQVEILSDETLLTTQQAADSLQVSRPFIVKMLENGTVPFMMVGKHRRVKSGDVVKLREKMQSDRSRSLDELASQAQELDLGY